MHLKRAFISQIPCFKTSSPDLKKRKHKQLKPCISYNKQFKCKLCTLTQYVHYATCCGHFEIYQQLAIIFCVFIQRNHVTMVIRGLLVSVETICALLVSVETICGLLVSVKTICYEYCIH